jgi:uncharacterized protein (DUF362 family)
LRDLDTSHRVLIKPNIAWGSPLSWKAPRYGFVTTSHIIEEIVRVLRERGCRHICIGEGSIVDRRLGADTAVAFRWAGMDRVARRYGVELVDFNQDGHEAVDLDGTIARVATRALGADFLIDVPVLKTHHQTVVSLGIKNLKGCLAQQSRKTFHLGDLHRLIALLATRLRPQLTLIDGIYGLERGPEFLGTAHRRNLIVASRDVLACDVVGAHLMGIGPKHVDHLNEYAVLTNGPLDLDGIVVKGDWPTSTMHAFAWERGCEGMFTRTGVTGISVRPPGPHTCSGCTVAMRSALLSFCSDNVGRKFEGIEVCHGATAVPTRDAGMVLLLGDCAIRANADLGNAVTVRGCPPSVLDAYVILASKTLGRTRAAAKLARRSLLMLGGRLGVYAEDFPAYPHYDAREFRPEHFE